MKEANWIKLTEKKNAEISNCTDCKIFPCKLEILRLQIATGAEKWSFFFTKAGKLFRQDQWHVIKCGGMWMLKLYKIVAWLVNCIETCDSVRHEIGRVKTREKCSVSQNGKYQVLYEALTLYAFWCFRTTLLSNELTLVVKLGKMLYNTLNNEH